MIAERIARALGGRRAGTGWTARCPAHNDGTPSFSIRDAGQHKVLVHCHAGCSQESVITALRALGLWTETGPRPASSIRLHRQSNRTPEPDEAQRTAVALSIWRSAVPAAGTLAEAYLTSRRLQFPAVASLRFHGGLNHPSGGAWPAMVAQVTRGSSETPIAIHRTFLARDGLGKAPVNPSKMMVGPCRGGAVRLAPPGPVLMVGEGIETCLAAMMATGLPAWAALSTSGLKTLDLPDTVRDVIILADGDDPGEAAACAAAQRWQRYGRRIRIARPPRGTDFNDILLSCKPKHEGA